MSKALKTSRVGLRINTGSSRCECGRSVDCYLTVPGVEQVDGTAFVYTVENMGLERKEGGDS